MPKVHRMYRHTWWERWFQQNGWMDDLENGTFGGIPDAFIGRKGRTCLPFLNRGSDGVVLQAPPPQQTTDRPHARLKPERGSIGREREPGIPSGIDPLDWYRAYVKVTEAENRVPLKTTEEKRDHYRDLIIDLYRQSKYSIDESVRLAFSKQGDELVRYLSDDKRHSLNRQAQDDDISSAV